MSLADGANAIGCGSANVAPATRKAMISASLSTVQMLWKTLPEFTPARCTRVIAQVAATPTQSAGAPGTTALKYSPNAMAARAIGAAKPTVADSQPARKPTAGW